MIREFWVKFLMAGDLGTTGGYYGISDTRPGGRKIKKKGEKKGSEGCLGDKTYKFGTVPKERKGDGGETNLERETRGLRHEKPHWRPMCVPQ